MTETIKPGGGEALVVRGGWDGHQPVETTELFIPFLRANGYNVRIENDASVYADADYMAGVDLVLHCTTMDTAASAEIQGLRTAVAAGTGLAGWHGGIADSYRNSAEFLQLVGGQFVAHPGRPAHERRGDGRDGFARYTVDMAPAAAEHPVTAGIDSFELDTEQNWVLGADYNDVLATTTLAAKDGDPWNRPVTCPAIWTRSWGLGKVFVATPGHTVEDLNNPKLKTIIERGLLWASR